MTAPRTPVDALAERYLDAALALDPITATFKGIAGHDDRLPDYTPDWHAAVAELRGRTRRDLDGLTPQDANDRVTVAALRERLEVADDLHAIGADEVRLNNIASPLQSVRDVFDLMPTATADDWAVIARRMSAVPTALAGYTASLQAGAARGLVPPRRQVEIGIGQCDDAAAFWGRFAAGAPGPVRADADRAAVAAADAYVALQAFLRDDLHPVAADRDPVGRERYLVHSRQFLGTAIDPGETYAWAQDEVARVGAELSAVGERIRPGATREQVRAHLDATHTVHGTDALREWMQERSDTAVAALAGTHFDIPDAIRTLECRIAPTQHGGIYYTGPSEDLVSRPGRMWWSVPKGDTEFATWHELTTVYHEGVPGHHLQIAQTAYRRELLNRWRRLELWVSGHGEGWALYAERLMADLGFLDDPADRYGMLDSQYFRAARVVLDVGIHCELPAPDEVGGGAWTYDTARAYLAAHASSSPGVQHFELDRYLGWPGQAPSYKLGERAWLSLREGVRRVEGDAFDLKAFHRRALDVGSVGLDVLRAAVLP